MAGHPVNLATIDKMIHESKGSIFLICNLLIWLGTHTFLLN